MEEIIAGIVNDIITEHYAYLSGCEKDSTEAEKSIADLQEKVSVLHANTEIAEHYFNHKMADRERLFQSASRVLEKAMEDGNPEMAKLAIIFIKLVHMDSPFSF